MKTISLLLHEDVYSSAIGGVIDLFYGTNHYLMESGRPEAFRLELVGEKAKNIQLDVPAQFICYTTIDRVSLTNLVIIPGFKGEISTILHKYRDVIHWIGEMHRCGAEIASMCVGSFFLAEAGLLNGKVATSHWAAAGEMQWRYPLVRVQSDRIITDQEGVYTSGGAFSALKLVLYIIEKFCGRETALAVSKRYSIDIDYTSQAHFAVFTGQRQHGDEEILKSQSYIEEHYASDLTIEQVSALCNTGKRNFIRRFKAATNNTPIEYLQRVRVEAAKKALENEDCSLDQVMDRTGYEDIKTFRLIFKRLTGLSPRDYRKRYSRKEPGSNGRLVK
ncbi:AraC family transcriptional regulator [Niastella koreensis]|uniref:Transcriptional regulator, AraC family with amidase-like domain n=2 Tax=Niastella koreensis TaxID=354356 RepID=G8TN07_NIAKG|nr:helix-turn-helix domain-containing protein [Niastella koreensis]AEV96669.1 transcriptional regulator, AraC family with amidase-like domain [Niastella koreensis GR20-10]OQP54175.1 AraC family transcriptional regulator [Niastella koreensis]